MLHTTNFPSEVVGNDSTYFLNKVTLFCDVFTRVPFTRAFSFVNNCFPLRSRVAHVRRSLISNCAFLRPCFLMLGWVCQWKPFWIPVGDNFQKAYLEEWLHFGDDSTGDPGKKLFEAISTANVSTMVRSSENQNCIGAA